MADCWDKHCRLPKLLIQSHSVFTVVRVDRSLSDRRRNNTNGEPAAYPKTQSAAQPTIPTFSPKTAFQDLSVLVPSAKRQARSTILGVPLGCSMDYVNSLSKAACQTRRIYAVYNEALADS